MVNQLKHSVAMYPIIKFSSTVTTFQVATSAREVTKLKLIALGSAAHVSVYDNADGQANLGDLMWALDASQQTNDTDDFINPLSFKRGIYLVCENGQAFNPQVCIAYIP